MACGASGEKEDKSSRRGEDEEEGGEEREDQSRRKRGKRRFRTTTTATCYACVQDGRTARQATAERHRYSVVLTTVKFIS